LLGVKPCVRVQKKSISTDTSSVKHLKEVAKVRLNIKNIVLIAFDRPAGSKQNPLPVGDTKHVRGHRRLTSLITGSLATPFYRGVGTIHLGT